MVGSFLYNVLKSNVAVFTIHDTILSNDDRGFSGFRTFNALMEHFVSAKLTIARREQYVKRTKTLIFDRDLPEGEAIQTADQYLENFKVYTVTLKSVSRHSMSFQKWKERHGLQKSVYWTSLKGSLFFREFGI
jgi:hypothetical protein